MGWHILSWNVAHFFLYVVNRNKLASEKLLGATAIRVFVTTSEKMTKYKNKMYLLYLGYLFLSFIN